MSKVILICGKIASGKTHLANQLLQNPNTVLLSADELMLKLFREDLGPDYEKYSSRAREYLHGLAEQFLRSGVSVILDWGFWSRADRETISNHYRSRGFCCEWHYLDVSDEQWTRNIEKRNAEVLAGRTDAYFADEGLLRKCSSRFEIPDRQEIDFWHTI